MDEHKAQFAKIANADVDELLKLNRVLAVTEAAKRRMFFEGHLEQSKNNLANAEIALKRAIAPRLARLEANYPARQLRKKI